MKQDIELQLSILKDLQKFLMQFCEDIRAKSAEFNRRVMQLRDIGIAVQIADNYETHYGEQTLQILHNLIANITDNDLPYINAKISQLEQILTGDNIKKVYQGYSGTFVYRIEGNKIYEGYSGTPVYRIEGNIIYQGYSNILLYRIEDNMMYEGYSGKPVYRIEGNLIYEKYSGVLVYRIE